MKVKQSLVSNRSIHKLRKEISTKILHNRNGHQSFNPHTTPSSAEPVTRVPVLDVVLHFLHPSLTSTPAVENRLWRIGQVDMTALTVENGVLVPSITTEPKTNLELGLHVLGCLLD